MLLTVALSWKRLSSVPLKRVLRVRKGFWKGPEQLRELGLFSWEKMRLGKDLPTLDSSLKGARGRVGVGLLYQVINGRRVQMARKPPQVPQKV